MQAPEKQVWPDTQHDAPQGEAPAGHSQPLPLQTWEPVQSALLQHKAQKPPQLL
jgi:hypothetical protein